MLTPSSPLFEHAEGKGLEQPLSVSAASALIRGQVEALGTVRIVGELSGPKLHSSGHFYADLKDETSTLAVVAWRSVAQYWPSVPAHGQKVEARGKLTTYPGQSKYQLQISSLQLAGQGDLLAKLEALKAKLMQEGLFDGARKRPLPYLPARIGLVTSPTGAVLHDMLHRLEDRCPRPVILAPSAVQGPEAPAQIVAAIEALNAMPENERPEVIIVARGGGSLEDLMAFNHEAVVRAVAASAAPIISGVGHEPDVTLCDFAADVRAPTPTAAAEMVVPVREDLLAMLEDAQTRLRQATQRCLQEGRTRTEMAKRLLPDPQRLLGQANQSLGNISERLLIVPRNIIQSPMQKLEALSRVLQAHHPEAPLQRGYALVWQGDKLVDLNTPAGDITLQFAAGKREGILKH